MLFMCDQSHDQRERMERQLQPIIELIARQLGMSADTTTAFHMHMWIHVHGIASMIVTHYLDWDEQHIVDTLSVEFHAQRVHRQPAGKWRRAMTATDQQEAIRAEGLTKRFGATTAVDGLDLTVTNGEIFALLGVNGAGKNTTIAMLTQFGLDQVAHQRAHTLSGGMQRRLSIAMG